MKRYKIKNVRQILLELDKQKETLGVLIGKKEIADQIVKYEKQGIFLSEHNGKLSFKAEKGKITSEVMDFLKKNKEEILRYLVKDQMSFVQFFNSEIGRKEKLYDSFPLTDIQSSYLLGKSNHYSYGGLACQIYLEFEYGELVRERVEEQWNRLIDRHPMLHAYITADGMQQVTKHYSKFMVKQNDLRNLNDVERTRQLQNIRDRLSRKKFQIDRDYAFAVEVTKQNGRDLMNFAIEFIIADWTSIWKILMEFEAMYFQEGSNAEQLQISFADYQRAYGDYRDSLNYARDKQYWEEREETFSKAPQIPICSEQEAKPYFKRYNVNIPIEQYMQMKDRVAKQGVTTTVAVITAYVRTLQRWSSTDQFAVNLTVLNRMPVHEQIMDIVGDFTSTELLEIDCRKSNDVTNMMHQIQSRLMEDMEHHLYTGVDVIRDLSKKQKNFLMPYVFTSAIGLNSKKLRGKMTDGCISQTPQVFIDCQAMDGDFGLNVNWDVREGIFSQDMIEDMFGVFKEELNHLVDAKEQSQSIYDGLPVRQQEMIRQVNKTEEKLPEHLLHAKIIRRAAEQPNKLAVIQGTQQATYGDVILYASAVADKIRELQIIDGSRIAVIMPKSIWQVYAVLGILGCNCVYVPIDDGQAAERKKIILKNADIHIVLTISTVEQMQYESCSVICVDCLKRASENKLETNAKEEDPAYIIHTSGSTGTPKGVVISHAGAVNTVEDINKRYDIEEEDTAIGLSQLYFDLSVYDIFGVLSVGATLVYPEMDRYTDPSYWYELVKRHKITIWNSVPAFMKMFTEYVSSNECFFPDLKVIMLSGDWIPLELFENIRRMNAKIQCVSLGGATEASVWSIYYDYREQDREWSSIPYGKPLANQKFYVMDHNLHIRPVGAEGELYIGGRGLALEYLNNQEETNRHFVIEPLTGQRLYRTGDFGKYMPDGNIQFLGRADSQVKINGYRIELGEIDSVIARLEQVESVVTFAIGKGIQEKKLYAYVQPKEAESCLCQQKEELIREQLIHKLPKYMIPNKFFFTEEMPLSENGKVDRKKIMEQIKLRLGQEKSQTSTEKMNPLEMQIGEIWKEALQVKEISREDDFYELGADSLVMGNVATKIKNKFQSKVPFEEILICMLNEPNVKSVADKCKEYLE